MAPNPTVLTERFKFTKSTQKSGKSLSNYLARLKSIDVKYEFEIITSEYRTNLCLDFVKGIL